MFSPDIFNLYGENIFRELCNSTGIKVDGYNIKNFRYAGDASLVSASEEKLQHLLSIVVSYSKEKDLCIRKMECTIISKKKTFPRYQTYIHDKIIRQVESFNYLGGKVTSNSKCD